MHDIDTLLDPDDRDAALNRGFTQHDTLTFRGKRLLPLCVATLSVLQQAGINLLSGKMEIADLAGFILIHSADEDENRKARRMVWKGREAWGEFVFQYLSGNPDIIEDLIGEGETFRRMIDDFVRAQTKSISAGEAKKNSGVRAI